MTNKEINRACKNYAMFIGANFVRRVPVLINGVRHQRITLEYKIRTVSVTKEVQLSEEVLKHYA